MFTLIKLAIVSICFPVISGQAITRMKRIQGETYFGSESLLKSLNPVFEFYKSLFTLPTEDMHIHIKVKTDIQPIYYKYKAIVIFLDPSLFKTIAQLNTSAFSNVEEVWMMVLPDKNEVGSLVDLDGICSVFAKNKRLHLIDIHSQLIVNMRSYINISQLELLNIEMNSIWFPLTKICSQKLLYLRCKYHDTFKPFSVFRILKNKNLIYVELDVNDDKTKPGDFSRDFFLPDHLQNLRVLEINILKSYFSFSVELWVQAALLHQNITFLALQNKIYLINSLDFAHITHFRLRNTNLFFRRVSQYQPASGDNDIGLPLSPNLLEYHGTLMDFDFFSAFVYFLMITNSNSMRTYTFENVVSEKIYFLNNKLTVLKMTHATGIDMISGGKYRNGSLLNSDIRGLQNLKEIWWDGLDYSPAHNYRYLLDYIMAINLPSVQLLSLQRNKLTVPEHFELCHGLKNLETVNLASNEITGLPHLIFKDCTKLRFIDLSNNKIKILSGLVRHSLLDHPHLKMDLSSNPLICSCHADAIDTIKWLNDQKHRHKNIDMYMCTNYEDMSRRQITGINIDSHTDSCERWSVLKIIFLVFVTNITCMLLVIMIYLCRKYRYRLLNLLYKSKGFCNGKRGHKFDFTMYLIYSREDSLWVYDTLIDILENEHGITCCVPDRDFPGIGFMSDIVVRFMDESQFFLAVLSENSINKPWVKFQLERARDHELRENKRIFYVKIGDLGNNIPSHIRQVLDSKIHINWPANVDSAGKRRKFSDKLVGSIRNEQLCVPCLCCHSLNTETLTDSMVMEPLAY